MGNNKLEPKMIDMMVKPGEVRNPNGKPKGTKNSKTILREMLALMTNETNPTTGQKMTEHEVLMYRWIQSGKGFRRPDGKYSNPNWKAIESVVNRVDGKVDQGVKIGEDPDNPISTALTIGIAKQLKSFVEEESKE